MEHPRRSRLEDPSAFRSSQEEGGPLAGRLFFMQQNLQHSRNPHADALSRTGAPRPTRAHSVALGWPCSSRALDRSTPSPEPAQRCAATPAEFLESRRFRCCHRIDRRRATTPKQSRTSPATRADFPDAVAASCASGPPFPNPLSLTDSSQNKRAGGSQPLLNHAKSKNDEITVPRFSRQRRAPQPNYEWLRCRCCRNPADEP